MEVKWVYMLLRDINEIDNAVVEVGRTNDFDKRRKKYGEPIQTIAVIPVINKKYVEKVLLKEFRRQFLSRKDIGYEYFEGNFDDMLRCFWGVIVKLSNEEEDEYLFE